jgi:anti-anti-sigma regulatory factor
MPSLFTIERKGRVRVVCLTEVAGMDVYVFKEVLMRQLFQKRVVIDFSSVRDVTCAVMYEMKFMTQIASLYGRRISLCGLTERVEFLLRFVGAKDVFDIFENVADALAHFPQPILEEQQ